MPEFATHAAANIIEESRDFAIGCGYCRASMKLFFHRVYCYI